MWCIDFHSLWTIQLTFIVKVTIIVCKSVRFTYAHHCIVLIHLVSMLITQMSWTSIEINKIWGNNYMVVNWKKSDPWLIWDKPWHLDIDGILPKGPYPPCLRMAGRALLAGYPRHVPDVVLEGKHGIHISYAYHWTGAPFTYTESHKSPNG